MANNEKSILRAEFKELAAVFFATHDAAALEKIHARIAERLTVYCNSYFAPKEIRLQRIAIYEPMRFELPIRDILSRVEYFDGAEFLYPDYDAADMWFVSGETRQKAEPDFIVVPGLFVDKPGNRLGRGKGYYDRYLRKSSLPEERRLFIGYPFQFLEFVPHEASDTRVVSLKI